MPINQVSQQFNAIVMAMAGADRIFRLMDEPVEKDDGYVLLVNAKEENGKLTESTGPHRTMGMEASRTRRTAPSTTQSCAATSYSTAWTSAIHRMTRSYSTT